MFDLNAIDSWRYLSAAAALTSYGAYCAYQYHHVRNVLKSPHQGALSRDKAENAESIWIVYASQSGQARSLAQQAAQWLDTSDRKIHVCRIEDNWQEYVTSARYILFIASTYGEGSAPDHALNFVRNHMQDKTSHLQGVHYGLLALGDRHYPAFCAFGQQLDAWLQASGAHPLFERIEADRLDEQSLIRWQTCLTDLGANPRLDVKNSDQTYSEWRFISRRCLNAGSPGNAIYLVVLQSLSDTPAHWQAGDLAEVLIPEGDGHPRAYSIANLPHDGHIELIVRKHVREDGQLGLASGWLTEHAQEKEQLALRLRNNPSFHLQQNLDHPLLLIGSGAGIAGLRAHLQAREKAIRESGNPPPERSAWLFFGERSGRHDHLCKLELEAWKNNRVLTRVDMAFSRDDPVTPYVQHNLLAQSQEIIEWMENGAHILICGNARKMAVGVDKALRRILGSEQIDQLLASGRICRDVF